MLCPAGAHSTAHVARPEFVSPMPVKLRNLDNGALESRLNTR